MGTMSKGGGDGMKGIKGWRAEMREGREVYICDDTDTIAIPCWTIHGTRYRVFHKGVEVTA